MKIFKIDENRIEPGTRRTIRIKAPELYTQTSVDIPAHIVHGRKEGPVLLICSTIHGDEISGIEIIRRLLNLKGLKDLSGTLITVPIVNVLGFVYRTRYLPDRRDLNRCFPGKESGTLASRMAHLFHESIFKHATHVVDLHTGAIGRANLPQIRCTFHNRKAAQLARSFYAPVIVDSDIRDGSLRDMADQNRIPAIVYEAGEALRFDESAIKFGVAGLVRVMKHLKMLKTNKESSKNYKPFIAHSTQWIRAEKGGIFRPKVNLGTHIVKGQILGYISDPLGNTEITIKSKMKGIVIGLKTIPLVFEGEALLNIARMSRQNLEGQNVEDMKSILDRDPLDSIL